MNYDAKKLKTMKRWRENDEEELSDHDEDREEENETTGNKEEKMLKEKEGKMDKDGKPCGCCCEDGTVAKQNKKE